MSWQVEMVTIVRHLINDLDAVSYSQARLEEAILVNAQLIYQMVDFTNTYTIDVDEVTLTPDPTGDTKDVGFINLVCLKTALMITYGEVKTLASQSFVVRDGPSSIDIGAAYKASKNLYDTLQEQFELEKVRYQAGNCIAGIIILTPYTVDNLHVNNPFT